ncbi:phosphodiester glycosidase family protein [bacterium]|nr:phosphodiester glycosidase family protein [bacterium]
MHKRFIHFVFICIFLYSCGNQQGDSDNSNRFILNWIPVDSLNQELPRGIEVFHAIHVGSNLRAWYVKVEEALPNIETRVVVSDDSDGRESVSQFSARLNAPVIINGGYFRMDLSPAKHVGILKVDDDLIHAATSSVLRGEQRFYLNRAAIGFDENDKIQIEWVSSQGDSIYLWEKPIANLPGIPGILPDTTYRKLWAARDILGGGPQLIRDDKIYISTDEEVFFGTSIPMVHPRTAAGITQEGDLILLLVDGRQLISRGVDLSELARILYDLGCRDAINLDGGGSSALVVNGILLNRPAGTTTEREVMSALAVFAHK